MRSDDPDPGRASDEMQAFVHEVQNGTGLRTASEADVLARGTMRTLGELIGDGQAGALSASLPQELAAEITDAAHGQATGADKDTFVDQVSGHVHNVDAEDVERQVRVVLSTVRAWAPDGQIEATLAQLPRPLAAMFA